MYSLHLTHPKWTHTRSSGQPCYSARGAVGGSVPCSRTPQSWYWRRILPPPTIPAGPEIRTHNLPLTSPTRYPLGHDCPPRACVRSGIWTNASMWRPETSTIEKLAMPWVWRLRPLGHSDYQELTWFPLTFRAVEWSPPSGLDPGDCSEPLIWIQTESGWLRWPRNKNETD